MAFSRERSFPDLCSTLAEATTRLDERGSTSAFREIAARAEHATPAELTEGVGRLVPALETVSLGNGTMLAKLTAGLIEYGADPSPVLGVLSARLTDGLERAGRFPMLAEHLDGAVEAPTGPKDVARLQERIVRAAPAAGLDQDEALSIVESWLTVNDWIPSLLLPLQQKRARQTIPGRDRLTIATAAMDEQLEDATWLLGLLLVLDDEPLIVVHRASGQAYAVRISGVGDNFQLHTLLAATLIGDPTLGLLPGERPQPAWIAAATDGPMNPPGGLRGQFNLVDATGAWIWNEGRPADIPVIDGARIVVLDPPPYDRSWNVGRVYPLMTPEVTLERVLPRTEAGQWAERIAPTKEP